MFENIFQFVEMLIWRIYEQCISRKFKNIIMFDLCLDVKMDVSLNYVNFSGLDYFDYAFCARVVKINQKF